MDEVERKKNSIRAAKLIRKLKLWSLADLLKVPHAIMVCKGFTPDDIEFLHKYVSKNCKPLATVSDLLKPSEERFRKIPFRCVALDDFTGGGISVYGLTEISGEAGTGKTQMAMQLALSVQLSDAEGGLGKKAVFICTKSNFSSVRLMQLGKVFALNFKSFDPNSFAKNIFVVHVKESKTLQQRIQKGLARLAQLHPIGIVIIDSVAGIFRLQTNFKKRAGDMRLMVKGLQEISLQHHFAIVCINEVSSVMSTSSSPGSSTVVPCLGLVWSNLVNTRFLLSRTDKYATVEGNPYVVRNFGVYLSSEIPAGNASFLITPSGVCDVPSD